MNDLVVKAFVAAIDDTDLLHNPNLCCRFRICRSTDESIADAELALHQTSVDDIINDPRFQKALRDMIGDARKDLLWMLQH